MLEDNNAGTGSVKVMNGDTPSASLSLSRWGTTAFAGGTGDSIASLGFAQSADSSASYGVYGSAVGTGANFAVYGQAFDGTTNYSGYFDGLLYAQSATASVKAFVIDHPMDPANKFLSHSSVESDERKNIYDGVVTTDSRGFAAITMPSWFEALNEDFRYQLTVSGDESDNFVLVKVAQKLRNGKFKIRTSEPNIEVNWMITGNRHDPTSNYMPLEVEREKNKNEKGKYLVPEAYGKDKSLGMAYGPVVKSPKATAKTTAKPAPVRTMPMRRGGAH
jgi:hypothetical protein